MMDMKAMRARVAADNDQDIEHAKQWMHESGTAELMAFWEYMNQNFATREKELMSRFAIIGFRVVMESLEAQKDEEPDNA